MSEDDLIDFRVLSEPRMVDDLARALSEHGAQAVCSSVVDTKYLGLDFTQAADVVTVVSATLIADPILPTLWKWIRRNNRSRIIIETPLGVATFESTQEFTEDQVRQIVKKLSGITP